MAVVAILFLRFLRLLRSGPPTTTATTTIAIWAAQDLDLDPGELGGQVSWSAPWEISQVIWFVSAILIFTSFFLRVVAVGFFQHQKSF